MAHPKRPRFIVNPATLVSHQFITEQDLVEAQHVAAANGTNVIATLRNLGKIHDEQLLSAYAAENGLRYYALEHLHPSPATLAMIPHEVARRYNIVPVDVVNGRLLIACIQPTAELKSALVGILDYELDYAIASERTLEQKVAEYYSATSEAAAVDISAEGDTALPARDLEDLVAGGAGAGEESGTTTQHVMLLIVEGINRGASDIHLEPVGKKMRVRYRVDGQLRVDPNVSYSPGAAARIIARIKVMTDLDSNERRRPQSGRESFSYRGRAYGLRVEVLPVSSGEGGEKVVMRILASDMAGQSLDKLDFSETNLRLLRQALTRPNGMVLVTGPTGSGKSTTLYSGVNEIATDDKNVMTVEDPVEYKFDGINQVQVREDFGLTFDTVLRSFLRADPDVILVGEIRDEATAQIATKAALTGHLVLSTLHTNTAALTVTRLVEMGLESYLVADALTAVLSQRLVRRLCQQCRLPYEMNMQEALELSGNIPDTLPSVFAANPQGCRYCTDGYSGRLPIHELLPVTRAIKAAIAEGKTAAQIEQMAIEAGHMTTLLQDGWAKVLQGLTDVAQIASLSTGDDFDETPAQPADPEIETPAPLEV